MTISLDESLNDAAAKKKKLNATHNRALNGMRQKIKKTLRENEAVFAKYRAVRFHLSLALRPCIDSAQDPEAFQRELEGADIAAQEASKPKKKKARTDATAADDNEDFETVGKGGKALNLTPEGVFKTLAAVLEARGKKATDRGEQTKTLEKLLQIAPSPYARLRVLLALTSSVFDYSTSTHAFMPIETWTLARSKMDELLALLEAEPQYRVQEEVPEYDEEVERTPEKPDDPTSLVLIRGSILSLVERLDDEFTRSLKDIDPHAVEYVDRLKDEKAVYEIVVRAQTYFERCQLREHLERTLMRRLEHVYSKVCSLAPLCSPSSCQRTHSPMPSSRRCRRLSRLLGRRRTSFTTSASLCTSPMRTLACALAPSSATSSTTLNVANTTELVTCSSCRTSTTSSTLPMSRRRSCTTER